MKAACVRRVAAVLAWLLLTFGGPVLAQEKVEVAPGGIVVLRQVQGSVTDATSDRGGILAIAETRTAPKQSTLIYLPPANARDVDDTVQYKLDGAPQTPIQVSVRPRSPTLDSPRLYDASFKAIFVLLVLAVLVESGLALLFRWRPFLDYFDSRSMNALVAFIFALILVRVFNLDITSQLISVYNETGKGIDLKDWMGWPGSLLTAMIIAGGSAGVNRIFQAFGFRPTSAEQQPPKPPELRQDQAWIAVNLVRDKAVGSADVLIKGAVAGTISGASPRGRFLRYLVRDKGRFPQTGGYTVSPGADYLIEVQGYDADGKPIKEKATWGPFTIAPRAIVDIELKV
jgi:hypothetical protein